MKERCCKVCGVGLEGFSLSIDTKTGKQSAVWNEYCSYGCTLASTRYKSVYM